MANFLTNMKRKMGAENYMFFWTVAWVIVGIAIGGILLATKGGDKYPNKYAMIVVGFPGEMFMRALRLIVIPIIVSSMIMGVAALGDLKKTSFIIKWGMIWYTMTLLIAIVTGLVLVLAIHPGSNVTAFDVKPKAPDASTIDTILDIFRSLVPTSIVEVFFRVQQSETSATASTGAKLVTKEGMNTLGVVSLSLVMGVCCVVAGKAGKPFFYFFESVYHITLVGVNAVMAISPICIGSLICFQVADKGFGVFAPVGLYIVTVVVGLIIHAFISYPIFYFVTTRTNPFKYYLHFIPALLTAAATSSSNATMPITIRCLEENAKIKREVTCTIVPLGTTINMDGTALYEAVAVLFIGQAFGYDMAVGDAVLVAIMACLAAIGAAGIPNAGLFTMILVLDAVGYPVEGQALILGVDWFLDRCRTTVNVLGDIVVAGVVDLQYRKWLAAGGEAETADFAGDNTSGSDAGTSGGKVEKGYGVDTHVVPPSGTAVEIRN